MRALFDYHIRKAQPKGCKAGNTSCKSTVSHGRLVVQCQGCAGKQDLTDHGCMNSLILAMAANPVTVEEIVLSRHWEVRYDRHCARAVSGLADVVRFLRGISFDPKFDECAGCWSNPRAVAERVVTTLPSLDIEAHERSLERAGEHRAACEKCIRVMSDNLGHAKVLLSSTNAAVNRMAYRVVSGDGA